MDNRKPVALRWHQWFKSVRDSGALAKLSGIELKVLWALAGYAHWATLECYPSRETLSELIGHKKTSSVDNALGALTRLGLIETVRVGLKGRTTTRRLVIQNVKVVTRPQATIGYAPVGNLGYAPVRGVVTRPQATKVVSSNDSVKRTKLEKAPTLARSGYSFLDKLGQGNSLTDHRFIESEGRIIRTLQNYGIDSAKHLYKACPEAAFRLTCRILRLSIKERISEAYARSLATSEKLPSLMSDDLIKDDAWEDDGDLNSNVEMVDKNGNENGEVVNNIFGALEDAIAARECKIRNRASGIMKKPEPGTDAHLVMMMNNAKAKELEGEKGR